MKQFILFFLVLLPVCAFAQFNETFDGPEIDSENPWKQSVENFIIKEGLLCFDASGRSLGSSYIYVPINYSVNMEWEFDVNLNYNPSNNNHARVYVYATGLPSHVSYYVQIGHNDNNVSLNIEYEKNGKDVIESLIKGRKDLLDSDKSSVHIKLTKENDSCWTLYTKLSGYNYYVREGTKDVILSDVKESGYLNLACRYKAKSLKNMITTFDNISVLNAITPTNTDPGDPDPEDPPVVITLPSLLNIEPLSLSELQFTFDLPVDKSNAQFSIVGIGNAASTSYGNTKTVIEATFPKDMIPGGDYTISYSGLTDLNGNKMDAYSQDFTLKNDEEENTPPSILINEIMAKPGDGPFFEYVELYNPTDHIFSLNELELWNGNKHKVLPDVVLSPHEYALLYNATIDYRGDGVAIPIEKFYALNDAGQHLALKSSSGHIIDEVTYTKATPAKSWERTRSGDWQLSTDPRGGTPGSVNSSEGGAPVDPDEPDDPEEPDKPSDPTTPVEPRELVFNELLPNPFTGGSEYIELYNRSGRPISLSGLALATRKTDGTLSTRYPLSAIVARIEPNGYVLLTKSKAGVEDFYTIQSPASLFEIPKLPILANTISTLVLFRTSDDVVIDEVSYSSKWHAPAIKDQKGVALERLDPEAETQSPSNWTSASATAGYGTPGYQNSQYGISSPDDPTGIEAPEWVPDSGHYAIAYYLDQPGYSCRAFVFNTLGQRVAEIANHELLGLAGRLTWDGSSSSGKRLQTGVYIFYAELYHTDGTVKRYKQVFLVR